MVCEIAAPFVREWWAASEELQRAWCVREIAIDLEMCNITVEVKKVASRQREWQQRMREEGRCIICGDEAVVACYCERHRAQRMRKIRERRGDDYQPQTCSICGKTGHNMRTCPGQLDEAS